MHRGNTSYERGVEYLTHLSAIARGIALMHVSSVRNIVHCILVLTRYVFLTRHAHACVPLAIACRHESGFEILSGHNFFPRQPIPYITSEHLPNGYQACTDSESFMDGGGRMDPDQRFSVSVIIGLLVCCLQNVIHWKLRFSVPSSSVTWSKLNRMELEV